MTRRLATCVVPMVLMLFASGCVSSGLDTAAVPPVDAGTLGIAAHVEDVLGDAKEPPAPAVVACWAAGCGGALGASHRTVAFPDLAAVDVHAGQDALLVDVFLGPMSETLAEFDRGDGLHRVAFVTTCLTFDDETRSCVSTLVGPGTDGAIVESFLVHIDEACNEWQACAARIPTTPVFGEQGALHHAVPLAALGREAAEARVVEVAAWAFTQVFEPTLPATHAAFTLFVPGDHKHEHFGPYGFDALVDALEPQPVDLPLVLGAAWPEVADGVVLRSGPGSNWGHGSAQDNPRYDLRAVRFEEREDALVLRVETGGWHDQPTENAHVVVIFGSAGSEVYEAGLLREGGETYGYVGHCITYACDGMFVRTERAHNHGGWQETLPVAFPDGVIEVAIPWTHLPDVQAGERLNFVLGITMYADLAVYVGEYGDDAHGDVHKMSLMDFVLGGEPYVFRIGAGEAADGHRH